MAALVPAAAERSVTEAGRARRILLATTEHATLPWHILPAASQDTTQLDKRRFSMRVDYVASNVCYGLVHNARHLR